MNRKSPGTGNEKKFTAQAENDSWKQTRSTGQPGRLLWATRVKP